MINQAWHFPYLSLCLEREIILEIVRLVCIPQVAKVKLASPPPAPIPLSCCVEKRTPESSWIFRSLYYFSHLKGGGGTRSLAPEDPAVWPTVELTPGACFSEGRLGHSLKNAIATSTHEPWKALCGLRRPLSLQNRSVFLKAN